LNRSGQSSSPREITAPDGPSDASGPISWGKAHDDADGTISLPHPVKHKIKDGLVALSLANLCFIKVGFDLLSDKNRYFNKLPVTTSTLLALVVNLLGFTLVFWLVMQLRRRFPSRLLHLLFHLTFLVLLLLPLDFVRIKFFNVTDYQVFKFLQQPVVFLSEVILLALIIWQHRLIARIAAIVVGVLSPLAIFLLAKIALVCLGVFPLQNCPIDPVPPPMSPVHAGQPREINQPESPGRATGAISRGQPRVIWIIFDEMDYRVTFEKPAAGFQFPEFEKLRHESLSATGAKAPADLTDTSMPALILGRRISAVDADDACDLTITFADTGDTTTWRGHPSVFSEARKLGFNTALVGWFLPYSRELGDVLNFCEWYPYPPFEPARAKTFFGALWQQIDSLTETVHLRRLFLNIHVASLQASLPLVTNAAYGLILLHLPAPHRPGIYLPDQDRFTAVGMAHMSKVTAYFDNLVLADREFGKLRRAMEASGQWDKTWVIHSADHSWRESKLYDGQRDFRVPYLIKPPGSPREINQPGSLGRATGPISRGKTASADYTRPFNTVLTHDLILAILRGEVTDGQNVAPWLDAHAEPSSPIIGQGID
jgi:hypothetical protein